ncbi:protein kinase family protein [soil metagenome]
MPCHGDDADEDGVQAQTLTAGIRLAGRYQIEDLVGETHRAQMWRAEDDVLNRSVSVQIVGADDLASEAFLVAARRATAVDDPRFLRVLDAARESGYAYVVREWASGVSLDNVLRAGPLSATRSVSVVREVAEAVAGAHRAGVQHRRIDPARILVTHSGAVRLLGLATDQALHAPDQEVADSAGLGEQTDVTALGCLLYACLVARWPSQRDVGGLPAAPTEHGRLLRPRQVRAGVDPATDDVCDRILDISARHDDDGLRTADEVARELAVLVPLDESTGSFAAPADEDDQTVAHGVLPAAPAADGPPPAVNRMPPPRTTQQTPVAVPAAPPRGSGARVPVWSAVALLAGLASIFAVLLWPPNGAGPGADNSTQDAAQASGTRALDIADVQDFDPLGNGSENPETVGNTFDGDPNTAWTTVGYYSELSQQKAGVGLVVDLGKPQDVSKVHLRLVGRPSTVEVYAASAAATAAPTSVDGLDQLGEAARAGTSVSLPVRPAVETRYLVVWLTALPEVEAGTWRGSVAEITVRG